MRVEWADWHQAFAGVQQPLREPNRVQDLGLARVLLGQRAQDGRDARVVGAEPDQPQRDDGVHREDGVVLLAVARQHVHHREFGVRQVQQCDWERDDLLHLLTALLDDVVIASQHQVWTYLFTLAH